MAGLGNHTTGLFWEYDSRLGRRWNIDPIKKDDKISYVCENNSPIFKNDANGDDDKTAVAVELITQEIAGAATATGVGVAAVPFIEVIGGAIALWQLLEDAPVARPLTPRATPPAVHPAVRPAAAPAIRPAAAQPALQKTTANQAAEKTKVLPPTTRKDALQKGKAHAQVPRNGRGGEDVPHNDINKSSRGKNWEQQRANGATRSGRQGIDKNGNIKGNKCQEHPDGHPDTGGKYIPEHHGSGHVHSTSPNGKSIAIPYK